MMKLPYLSLVLVLAVAGCEAVKSGQGDAAAVKDESLTVLANVRVFDVSSGTMSTPRDILISDGRIEAVRENIAVRAGMDRIDCTGRFALPGLFDCHTHLSFLTTKGDEEMKSVLNRFVANGVTQVRDVGGPVDVIGAMDRSIAGGEFRGPEIFFTGPMLEKSPMHWAKFNEELPGFTVAVDTPEDVDRILAELVEKGAGLVKTFNRIDRDVYAHLVAAARKRGLKVVHDPGMPLFHAVPMDWAVEQGVTSIEHAKAPWPVVLKDDLKERHDELLSGGANMMAMMPLTVEAAGLGVESISAERLERLIDLMLAKNACLCPTLQVFDQMGGERPEDVPAPMWEIQKKVIAGMREVGAFFTGAMARRGVRLLVGQDGGSPEGTFAEMGHLRRCGVSAADVIRGATIFPAQWLGVDDRLGSIAPGKQARIVIVDRNPLDDIENVRSTYLVVNGKEILPKNPKNWGCVRK